MATKYFNGGNISNCASDIFMQGISEIDHPYPTIFTGKSCGRDFMIDGTDYFYWGRRKSHNRQSTTKVDLIYNGYMSSIALESIYAFIQEAYETGKIRNSYLGLMGNDKSNNVAQQLPFNPKWVEIVNRRQNSAHRNVWHSVMNDTGLRIVVSAVDYEFRKYIEDCIGNLTPQYIKQYPGIQRVIYQGTEYWEVN